ncbi:Vacuolar segregation protein 7 [Nakaseomyces glabratus]|uniref:Vacuolar segregation protein 7 n=1 Tax=Candida glabrata TaxID=5478 RepID=A0A0W0D815_CANGB|nr:Vacuolar segregation protein 7 [Nakaseomyces glabratus]KTB07622.1 Vacuolar segregation protein 7 [Nakaseomyces glabratus]KTB07693.1 Vacuolar segregation protein 7 [Nakaseomyces glabratus]KTB21395.1 Vacuolar segregation protein 7 [Nakaseomyces glabratus]
MDDEKKLTVETETVEAVPAAELPRAEERDADGVHSGVHSGVQEAVHGGEESEIGFAPLAVRTPDEFVPQGTASPLNAVKTAPPLQTHKTLIDSNPLSPHVPHANGNGASESAKNPDMDTSNSAPAMSQTELNKPNAKTTDARNSAEDTLFSTTSGDMIKSKMKIVPSINTESTSLSALNLPAHSSAKHDNVTDLNKNPNHVLDKIPLQRQASGIATVGASIMSNAIGSTPNNSGQQQQPSQLGQQAQKPEQLTPSAAPPAPLFQNRAKDRPNMVAMMSRERLLNTEGAQKGSEPSMSKKVTTPDEITTQTTESSNAHRPTKTDFFAARLASAVGENEVSDSEETFVYESAANSTKNMIYPSTSNINDDQHQVPHNIDSSLAGKMHSITTKSSVPVLNGNTKLFNRLKNTTRHISTGGMPNSSLNLPSHTTHPQSNLSQVDTDITSIRSSHKNQSKVEQQSIRSMASEQRSPDRKVGGLASLDESNSVANSPSLHYKSSTNFMPMKNQARNSHINQRSISVSNNNSNGALGRNPSISGHNQRAKTGAAQKNASKASIENKNTLRTTVSKIFDANGASLRRYSGVPDNVNLEDFIEQNDLYTNQGLNSKEKKLSRQQKYMPSRHSISGAHTRGSERSSPIDADYLKGITRHTGDSSDSVTNGGERYRGQQRLNNGNDTKGQNRFIEDKHRSQRNSAIEGEANLHETVRAHDSELDVDIDDDEDDDRSMFYYSHGSNLEARPQISEYEGDAGDQDSDEEYVNGTMTGDYFTNHTNIHSGYDRNPFYGSTEHNEVGSYYPPISPLVNVNASSPNKGVHCKTKDSTEFTPLNRNSYYVDNNYQYSPHNFYTKKSNWSKFRQCFYFTISVLVFVSIGFVLGFLLAANKELREFDIVLMDNVISSTDELLFDLTTTAFNPGIFPIYVDEVEFDIFAKTSFLKCNVYDNRCVVVEEKETKTSVETIFLGIVKTLETPLKFQGGFFNRNFDISQTSVRLHKPGSDEAKEPNDNDDTSSDSIQQLGHYGLDKRDSDESDDVTKWKLVIKHDYELILRGNIKYKVPFFNTARSIAVQKSAEVRPSKQ